MKSIALALAAIIATTSSAWATPATPLTYSQLVEIVHNANDDPSTLESLAGTYLVLNLRPSTKYPYFAAAGNVHGLAFICQTGFEDFTGGPVAATLVEYERGEDGRDYVKLGGCTGLER